MTDQEINAAVAECCGWKDCGDGDGEFSHLWRYQHPTLPSRKDIPDYANDLNAMHVAEKVLTPTQAARFRLKLSFNSDGPHAQFQTVEAAMCHATARQRAEAFLRTVGKWRDA